MIFGLQFTFEGTLNGILVLMANERTAYTDSFAHKFEYGVLVTPWHLMKFSDRKTIHVAINTKRRIVRSYRDMANIG